MEPSEANRVARLLQAQDYLSIVFRQFRKDYLGMIGFGIILVLFTIASWAPFLAESKPIVLHYNDRTYYPLFQLMSREDIVWTGSFLIGAIGWIVYSAIRKRKILWIRIGEQGDPPSRRVAIRWTLLVVAPLLLFFGYTAYSREHRLAIFVKGGDWETGVPIEVQRNGTSVATKVSWDSLPSSSAPMIKLIGFRNKELGADEIASLKLAAGTGAVRIYDVQPGSPAAKAGLQNDDVIVKFNDRALPVRGGSSSIAKQIQRLNLRVSDFAKFESEYMQPGDWAWWAPIRFGSSDVDIRDGVETLMSPSQGKLFGHHLGTDDRKRDTLAMMIHSSRISLTVGFFAVMIYISIGVIVGSVAGYFGGWVDIVIMRVIEIVMCFPSLFLIITILSVVKPSIFWVMAAIAIVGWTTVARLIRAEFLKLRKSEYVLAARALGSSNTRIMFRHILPNAMAPVLVSATFGIASAILYESALSFLGIGVPPDVPTWGSLLHIGRDGLPNTWWLALIPGFAIFITVTCFNLFGEALRDAVDPRLKGSASDSVPAKTPAKCKPQTIAGH